jgi:hypothetical protein
MQKHKHWSQQPDLVNLATAADSAPGVNGVPWLEPNLALERTIKMAAGIILGLLLILMSLRGQ